MDITVRRLTENDLTEDSGFFDTLENLTDVRPIKDASIILETMHAQGSAVFIAEANGQICGATTLLIEQKFIHQGCKIAHIEDVATRSGYEGNGIGSKVVRAAIEYAKEQGCYRIILDCSDELVGYYERFGFCVHGNEMRLDLNNA